MKKIIIVLTAIVIAGCTTTVVNTSQDFSDLEREYKSFSTKALSDSYVKRMFGKYLGNPVNSVQLSRQLEFSRYLKMTGDANYETSLKSMFLETPVLYDTLIGNTDVQSKITQESSTFGSFVIGLSPYNYKSCKALKNAGAETNGVYSIDQDNNISTPKINIYCDMTTDEGGWALVVAQYENNPISWNEGIQSDYDPTLATKKSFALNSSQLPSDRTEIAFGKNLNPTEINFANFVYTTQNISKTLLNGKKNGNSYHIHRSGNGYYGGNDPEHSGELETYVQWHNTLTFDKTGGAYFSWAFSPQHNTSKSRGYAYNGSYYEFTAETFAWTVWVR